MLVALKNEKGLNTHKMTQAHINFHRDVMRVSLAAQTFSSSSALSMQFQRDINNPDFKDVDGTIEFTFRTDKLFNILNSDTHRADDRFKSAITTETCAEIISFLDDTSDYYKRLTLEPFNKPIIKSTLKMGFKGFLIDIANLKNIYVQLVQTHKLQEFPVRRICQCSLESFFSRCRSYSKLGSNTNPTVQQFQATMKKIQVNNEVTSSLFANCTDHLDILYVSSKGLTKSSNPNISTVVEGGRSELQQVDEMLECNNSNPEEHAIEFAEDLNDRELHLGDSADMISASNKQLGVAFAAGQVEIKIEASMKIKCFLCASAFHVNEKFVMESYPSTKHSRIPCRDTYKICQIAEPILDAYLLKADFNYALILNKIIAEINEEEMFTKTIFSCDAQHKDQLIKLVVETYITYVAKYFARKFTLDNQLRRISSKRKKLTQVTHFQGR